MVGGETDEPAADRDVVQLAEDLLQLLERVQIRGRLSGRKRGSEELAAVAQALDANAQRVARGGIVPVDSSELEELGVRALQGRGAELGQTLVAWLRHDRARLLCEPREGAGFDRTPCRALRLVALRFGFLDKAGLARAGEPFHQHVPVARSAELRRQTAQRASQLSCVLLSENSTKRAQCGPQPPLADAQLMQEFGIVRREHAAGIGFDLRQRRPAHRGESALRRRTASS